MTTNQELAAEVINGHCCSYCHHFGAEQAQDLADAGLLRPELSKRYDGDYRTAFERTVYGIILPDWETAEDEGKFSVLEIQPDDVTYDSYVEPEELTILEDMPRVFPAGYSSLMHPGAQETN